MLLQIGLFLTEETVRNTQFDHLGSPSEFQGGEKARLTGSGTPAFPTKILQNDKDGLKSRRARFAPL